MRIDSVSRSSPSATIARRRVGDREQPARRLVDADIGRLRRQQHRGQQLEHAGVLQLARRIGIGRLQRREEGFDVGGLHGPGRLVRARASAAATIASRRSESEIALRRSAHPPRRRPCAVVDRRASLERLVAIGWKPGAVDGVALPRGVGLLRAPGLPAGPVSGRSDEGDAVDRTDRKAQLAAGAQLRNDGVHLLRRADDAVDRAGLQAQRAADAPGLVDDRELARPFDPVRRVERLDWPGRQRGEPGDALRTTRRTLVDRRAVVRDGVGIRAAIGVAAARALGLRQRIVQRGSERCVCHGRRLSVAHRLRFAAAATRHAPAQETLGAPFGSEAVYAAFGCARGCPADPDRIIGRVSRAPVGGAVRRATRLAACGAVQGCRQRPPSRSSRRPCRSTGLLPCVTTGEADLADATAFASRMSLWYDAMKSRTRG